MSTILLSINPEYVENIFNGNKKYEYRKQRCKKSINKIIIYSTAPVMKVVGEAVVEDVLEGSPTEVWQKTKEESGTSESFYQKYYEGRDTAVAYKLKDIVQYETPKDLSYYGIKVAPQSFVYIR